MWERLCVFCLKYNGHRDALNQKKAGFPCSALNAGSSFISQDEGMSEYPVETVENAIVLNLFWREGLTSIWDFKICSEFNVSKGDNAWLFVKIDSKTNTRVPSVMTYTLVVMSSIERYIDTDVCATSVWWHTYSGCDVKYGGWDARNSRCVVMKAVWW